MSRSNPSLDEFTAQLATAVAAASPTPTGPATSAAAEPPVSTAGSSLERTSARLRAERVTELRARHGNLVGRLAALLPAGANAHAFDVGAAGERKVAHYLHRHTPDAYVLHNRRLAHWRRYGDIDHVAVTASGVYVIDTKHYRGATIALRHDHLVVRGRDRTDLVTKMVAQTDAVRHALASLTTGSKNDNGGPGGTGTLIPVHAVLCFVAASTHLWRPRHICPAGSPTSTNPTPVAVTTPRTLKRLLRRPGALTADQQHRIHTHLTAHLPPA